MREVIRTTGKGARNNDCAHIRSPSRQLWFQFVATLVRPGCLTHLIVLRFAHAFFEHLRTLAPSLGIFVFSDGVRRLPSG